MEHNPYAPPRSEVEGATVAAAAPGVMAPTERLYSPNEVAIAAFLGSPVAAAWLAAANFRAMDQSQEARRTLGLGVVATILIFVVTFMLPEKFPNSVVPLAYTFALRALAEQRFKAAIAAHRAAGGAMYSSWRAAGIGLLCGLIVVGIVFGILIALDGGN